MNHRAAILSVLLPIGYFVAVQRWPAAVAEASSVLRAALAWVS